jgi:hypothetical protein
VTAHRVRSRRCYDEVLYSQDSNVKKKEVLKEAQAKVQPKAV